MDAYSIHLMLIVYDDDDDFQEFQRARVILSVLFLYISL